MNTASVAVPLCYDGTPERRPLYYPVGTNYQTTNWQNLETFKQNKKGKLEMKIKNGVAKCLLGEMARETRSLQTLKDDLCVVHCI